MLANAVVAQGSNKWKRILLLSSEDERERARSTQKICQLPYANDSLIVSQNNWNVEERRQLPPKDSQKRIN